jgi:hypothetical protein
VVIAAVSLPREGLRRGGRAGRRRPADRFLDQIQQPSTAHRTAQRHPRSIVGSCINFLHRPNVVWSVSGYPNWRGENMLNLSDQGAREEEVLARRTSPAETRLLTGCGTLVPAGCYREVGLYDARMCPQYHADAEFTLRAARRGWRLLVDLHAVVHNDVPNTCGVKSLWQQRSPWCWRPLLALYLRYCPRGWLLRGLLRRYVEVLADTFCPARPGDRDPGLVRVRKKLPRPLAGLLFRTSD